jgi:5'-3' exonuclease
MDGVAPFAKIQQQRQRRYKILILKEKKKELENKYNNNVSENETWDSNLISPDTYFMKNLEKYLLNLYPNYVFSGTNEPGEGEHKIIEYILKNNFENVCIYGLDADLILLSWIIQIKKNINVYLIRETIQFGNKDNITKPFTFMNISKLLDSFYTNLGTFGNKIMECSDFIFISFFLGNDFLPNLFGIHLGTKKPDGLTILLDCYIQCKKFSYNFYLLNFKNKNCINWRNLQLFIETLYKRENNIYENFYQSYFNFKSREKEYSNLIEKEMNEFENNIEKNDPIGLRTEGWQDRFVQRYFDIPNMKYESSIDYVVNQYLSGLIWNVKYYFKTEENLSFGYIYPFMMSPTIEMINKRLKEPEDTYIFEIFYNSHLSPVRPLDPQKVLEIILPWESYKKCFKGKYDFVEKKENTSILNIKYLTDYKHFWNECFLLLDPIEWK